MINKVQAALSLDALPLGSMVAAAFVDDDGTATVILFEHREHEGAREWWDKTRNAHWWTAKEIAQAFDDMVITARPDADEPATKMTGRLRFRYSDGSYLEWSTKDPTPPARVREVISTFAAMDRAAAS